MALYATFYYDNAMGSYRQVAGPEPGGLFDAESPEDACGVAALTYDYDGKYAAVDIENVVVKFVERQRSASLSDDSW